MTKLKKKYNYDVCFICFNDLKHDARTLNLARTLVKNGIKVCVIALGCKQDFEIFDKENIKLYYIEKINNSRMLVQWLYFLLFAFKFIFCAKSRIFWAEDLFSLFNASALSIIHQSKLYYDSREIFSALGNLHDKPFRQFFLTNLEKCLIKKVNNIIVSGQLDAEYLKKYFKHDTPYHVIMNIPFYKEVIKSNLIKEKYNILENKYIIIYQGIISQGRGILPIVQALPELPDYIFCIVGSGNYKDIIIREAERLKVINQVVFLGQVDYDQLHEYTCSADIGVSFIEPISLSYNLALPNKMFEYCMAGIPSLLSDLPAIKQITDNYHFCKLISSESTPKQISEAIKEIMMTENRKQYINQCKEASKIYCYENQEKLIMELVR